MNKATRFIHVLALAIVSLTVLTSATSAQAQSTFVLSNSDDFSSDSRAFGRGDVLHMQIVAPHVDFGDLDENTFRLKPARDGNDIEGSLTNHFDGTYTASLPLELTDASVNEWEWRARIKDDAGQEFEMQVDIQIGAIGTSGDDNSGDDGSGENNSGDDSSGDDNSGDDNGQNDDGIENDEVELTGHTDEIGADFIVVAGTSFVTDGQTGVFDDNGFPITLGDLPLGGLVQIRGDIGSDGVLRATKIKIEDDEEDEVELTGTVDDIGGGFIVVSGMRFQVNGDTVVLDDNGFPMQFMDVSVGTFVEIRAESAQFGDPLANRIKVEDQIEDEVEITGDIEQITADSIVILGQTFRVLGNVTVLDDQNNIISFSSLLTGQRVEIRGELQPGGDLVALRIKLEDSSSSTVSLVAPIEQIRASSFDLLGLNVSFATAPVITSSNATALAFADLVAGQTVSMKGRLQANGSLEAEHVEVQEVAIISGAIDAVHASGLTIDALSFQIDDHTIVLDTENRVVSKQQIFQAASAEVRGVAETGGIRATKIKLFGNSISTASESAESSTPSRFHLNENYPNPFNPTTTISFELASTVADARVELTIFDVLGRKVKTLLGGSQISAGTHQVTWNGTNDSGSAVTSGLYLYKLQVADQVQTRTMTLLK